MCGLFLSAAAPADPGLFPAQPGAVFPVYAVFRAVLAFVGGEVLPSQSNDPLVFDGLVLRGEPGLRVLLANYTPNEVAAQVGPVPGSARLRLLTAERLAEQQGWFSRFQQEPPQLVEGSDQGISVVLPPFAIGFLDIAEGERK